MKPFVPAFMIALCGAAGRSVVGRWTASSSVESTGAAGSSGKVGAATGRPSVVRLGRW